MSYDDNSAEEAEFYKEMWRKSVEELGRDKLSLVTLRARNLKLLNAARNMRDVKGRHHSEIAYKELMAVLAEVES